MARRPPRSRPRPASPCTSSSFSQRPNPSSPPSKCPTASSFSSPSRSSSIPARPPASPPSPSSPSARNAPSRATPAAFSFPQPTAKPSKPICPALRVKVSTPLPAPPASGPFTATTATTPGPSPRPTSCSSAARPLRRSKPSTTPAGTTTPASSPPASASIFPPSTPPHGLPARRRPRCSSTASTANSSSPGTPHSPPSAALAIGAATSPRSSPPAATEPRSSRPAPAPLLRTASVPTRFPPSKPSPSAPRSPWTAPSPRSGPPQAAAVSSPQSEPNPLQASQFSTRSTVSRRTAISCLLLAILLAGLAAPAAARTRPRYGGTLRIETVGDPWQLPSGIARRLVLDGLTTLDAAGNVRPALATDWQSENAGHRWIFRLRPGVRFHDGSPLTTIAVVASLNASCPSDCPWTSLRASGAAVVFSSDAPMPNLPALLAGDEFLIALTLSSEGKTPTAATGTGPFQVTGFSNGVLSLSANDTCWQGRPFVDTLEIRTRRALSDQRLDLVAGRADVIEVPAEDARQARQQHLLLLASPPVQLLALEIADSGPLANPNLRAAIALAVDRSALANVIFQKEGQVAASLLPQSLSGYAFLFAPERDLARAQQLRGGITPPSLPFRVEGDGALQLAGQRIALNLREAGFPTQLNSAASHPDLVLRILPIEFPAPAATLEQLFRRNDHPDPVEDNPAAEYKAERGFLDRKTVVPLLHLPRVYALSPRVRDLALHADGSLDLANASLEASP
ncbi:hypothetical protein DYQ86_20475 [Acidobacteria bacterium AB60]|nr:hypothetical protein DYQ86_20475 [Acidobacteria bacterium AB60]